MLRELAMVILGLPLHQSNHDARREATSTWCRLSLRN
jgi:hypothetical protein